MPRTRARPSEVATERVIDLTAASVTDWRLLPEERDFFFCAYSYSSRFLRSASSLAAFSARSCKTS